MIDMKSTEEIRGTLPQFTGTETWFRHGLVQNVLYTEGVQYLAEAAEAYWLIDLIASYQHADTVKAEPFQVWHFTRSGDAPAAPQDKPHRMTMTDGNSEMPVVSQAIPFTTFPLPEIRLYAIAEGERRIILLPSEY